MRCFSTSNWGAATQWSWLIFRTKAPSAATTEIVGSLIQFTPTCSASAIVIHPPSSPPRPPPPRPPSYPHNTLTAISHKTNTHTIAKKVKNVLTDGPTTKSQRLPLLKTATTTTKPATAVATGREHRPASSMGATNGPIVADSAGCDCCGRSHSTEGSKNSGLGGVGGVGMGTVGGPSTVDSSWGQGSTKSMVPAPPAGPAGSLPSAATSSVAPQPLGSKVSTWFRILTYFYCQEKPSARR